MEDGLVLDGVIAASVAQARNLWLFREGMNEGQAKRGRICAPIFLCRCPDLPISSATPRRP